MSATTETLVETCGTEAAFDIEAVFRLQYPRIARVIARVVRDPARAEELAVEVFLKLSRLPRSQILNAEGWLYRVAVRAGLDELRRQTRRIHYERLAAFFRLNPNPEEIRIATEEQERVRIVLAALEARHAELLLLRSHDLSYTELAAALDLNPTSIGTLLHRAQQVFRKEYLRRYGTD